LINKSSPQNKQPSLPWQILQEWLSQDEEGRALLARFQADPDGEAGALAQWLQAHSAQAPLQLATYISDAHVEKLINIAHAGVVRIEQVVLPTAPPSALYQLPPDISDFTGRKRELDEVISLFTGTRQGEEIPASIVALVGMPGVGKSALAIHAAHHLKDHFPDAQLYIDLRGAEGEPLDPSDVLASFLRDLGVEDRSIPKDLHGRSGLFRSLLAHKQALLLLDNASDEAQVRPLLPGSPSCAVLVTSRKPLSSLEGATIIDLELMTEDEALEFLERLGGIDRVQAEHEAAKRIIELCGHLPLAVRIAGGKLKSKPHWSLSDYVSQLSDERRRLERLQLGDLEVRAGFALSYQDLAPEDARLFRLLGLLAGPDFAPEVAAAILATDPEDAFEAVEHLVDVQLLEPSSRGRYRFHDLVHLFARERLEQEESVETQQAAQIRAAQWYLVASNTMNSRLQPETSRQVAQPITIQPDRSLPEVKKDSYLNALAWFESERMNLLAAVVGTYQSGVWDLTWRLAANLVNFCNIRALWADWEQTSILALEAARKAGDPYGENVTLNNLGFVYDNQSRWDEAITCYQESLDISRELGDRHTESRALNNLGLVYYNQGQWDKAITNYQESLDISRELGDQHTEAQAISNLASIYNNQGRWNEAITCYEKSLPLFHQLEDRHGECMALNNLAMVYYNQSRWDEAIACYQESLAISRELGDRHTEGLTLNNLGLAYTDQGRWDEAVTCYQENLAICRELGDRRVEALTLNNLGIVNDHRGLSTEAITCYEESLAICRELGDRYGAGLNLNNLGLIYLDERRFDEALKCFEDGLAICRELGDRYGEGQALNNLGLAYANQGQWEDTIQMYEKALAIYRELGDRHGEGQTMTNLGIAYAEQGLLHEAITCYERDLAICRELGDHHGEGQTLMNMGGLYEKKGDMQKAIALLQEALTKLHPDSPEYKKVEDWLQQSAGIDRP
jgi:tetratricopeptide (TPR) repeat protein